jgi:hypothetical protein
MLADATCWPNLQAPTATNMAINHPGNGRGCAGCEFPSPSPCSQPQILSPNPQVCDMAEAILLYVATSPRTHDAAIFSMDSSQLHAAALNSSAAVQQLRGTERESHRSTLDGRTEKPLGG